MTPLQQKIYRFIASFLERHNYAPSLKEIAQGINISPNSISLISRHIHALVHAGYLKYYKKGYRNIQLTKQTAALPIVGTIAAGNPIEAIPENRFIDIERFFKADDHFLLEVKGHSMIDEGILDGDLVICKTSACADEGQVIVALIDNHEATLKRISYKINNHITLIPANQNLKPKAYSPHRIKIQGVFVGLLRLR